MAGCGGACGGGCSCQVRRPADPRRFGIRAADANILVAVRALQLEDTAGIAVVLTQDEHMLLLAAKAELASLEAEKPEQCDACGCELARHVGDAEDHAVDCPNLPL